MCNISKKSEERLTALRDDAVAIGRGESMRRTVIISPDSGAGDTLPACFALGADSRLDIVLAVMPGAGCDISLAVILEGEGAEANISGLYICPGEERVNISVELFHKVPHCVSRQLFKGIAGGSSKIGFFGKIIVAQDAQKTEAYQENHNILLSETAIVNTKPQLEIYADDVKCSHGATIGKLNEEEQFYMRSRGISMEDAKALQMISFLSPVASAIADVQEREALLDAIEAAVRQL
ncbi:MAG: SufD family Fe-S cluster assembly protein [Bacteroidales bacterium]|nr:SufD family Fe-S cluster assembly protein [Bacteroidales bacterium]